MSSSVFVKTMENVRKHRYIKLVTTEKKLFSVEKNYQTAKWFSGNLLSIKMKKLGLKMNKSVYLIPNSSKIAMYEYWYDHAKPKYEDNATLVHRYRKFHSRHEIRRCLCRPC